MSVQQKKQNHSVPKPSRRYSNPENRSSSTKDTPPSKGNTTDASASTVADRFSMSSHKGSQENDYRRSNLFQNEQRKDNLSRHSSCSGSRSSQNPEVTECMRKTEENKLQASCGLRKDSPVNYLGKLSPPSTALPQNYRETTEERKEETSKKEVSRTDNAASNELEGDAKGWEDRVLAEMTLNQKELKGLISECKTNLAVSPRPRTRSFTSADVTSKSIILDSSRSFSVDGNVAEDSNVLRLKACSRHISTQGSENTKKPKDEGDINLIELAKTCLSKEHRTTSKELFRIAAASSEADDEERILLVQSGFVPRLVEIFDREYENSEGTDIVEKIHVASIVGNLALTEANEEVIASSGLLERFIFVIKALSPYNSLDHLTVNFLQECCRAIRNLSENATTMLMILQSETISSFTLLVANVWKQSHSCVTEAIAAMRNLCKSEECRSHLVYANGVNIVCDILNETLISPETNFSSEMISQICSFLAEIVIDNRAAKQLVSYESVFLLLIRNMHSDVPEIAFESIRAVANCFASESAQRKFSHGSIVGHVISKLEESVQNSFCSIVNDMQEVDMSLKIAISIEASRALANLALGVIRKDYSKAISVAKTCAQVILNEDEENFPAPIINVLFELRGECLRCVANLSEESNICVELATYLLCHSSQNVLNLFLRKCIQYCGETFREDAARLVSNLLEIPSLENESSVLCRLGNVLSEANADNGFTPDHNTSSLLIPFLSSFTRETKVENQVHDQEGRGRDSTNFSNRFNRNSSSCETRDINITGPFETFVEELHRLKEFCKKAENALRKGVMREEISIESLASAFEQVCATRECLDALFANV
ncbi:hypothetical protein GAYE_SCF00G1687 [Galdieria yellowstonensis]|uniref:Uncharacterized protein n=1 Tax=Galdieria yellowstonensis TaxID=3028027 RepID=A0AAV9I987_9RHOD|nr:hypothetical protein GAYE_SCF00G1687 [Galdieria yellowstonensis]